MGGEIANRREKGKKVHVTFLASEVHLTHIFSFFLCFPPFAPPHTRVLSSLLEDSSLEESVIGVETDVKTSQMRAVHQGTQNTCLLSPTSPTFEAL